MMRCNATWFKRPAYIPFCLPSLSLCLCVALAFVYSGFHAGTIGAYLLSPIVMDSLGGWRALFFTYGWLGLLLLGPWLWLAKDSPTIPIIEASSSSSRPSSSIIVTPTKSSLDEALQSFKDAPWKDFVESKGAWAMLLAHSARNWGLYTSLAWTPTFYAEQYGIGVRDSAWLSVLPSVAGAAGGFLAGALSDYVLRSTKDISDESKTRVRKAFQAVGLLGPAFALATLANSIPEEAWVAQMYLMASLGLQSFNAGGFEAGNQDKAGPKWTGMLYSITSLPAVMSKFCLWTLCFELIGCLARFSQLARVSCFAVGTFGVFATGLILDQTHDWSVVFAMNAAVNVLGAIAFIALFDSKREFD